MIAHAHKPTGPAIVQDAGRRAMISSGRICCGGAIKPTADMGPWALVWGLMLACRINPARQGLVEVCECRFLCFPTSHAAGKLGNCRYERPVRPAPAARYDGAARRSAWPYCGG